MLKAGHIDLQKSGVLIPLISDYLKQNSTLNQFYSFYPDTNGFDAALKHADYKYLEREKLVNLLIQQSKQVKNTNPESTKNIEQLKQKNTFTITTGHQLCLFTGPLYFIYKIISCINLAEALREKFPKFNFIPVYWMAGEDHDFAEVNHFRLFGKMLLWESTQTGSVGEFNTNELVTVLNQLKEILGTSLAANNLTELFSKAYLENKNLLDATRYLVNELFGEYGLVSIDGNEKTFKQQFRDILSEDIFNNSSAQLVEKSNLALSSLGYSNQVNPRTINCFYTQKGIRARIEKKGENYSVVGTELNFSETELKSKLTEDPQCFSPNVVLRPLFQQRILPNLAYVGGPGELAYWLQYKSMFEYYKIFFPLLVPRNFVTLLEKTVVDKLGKLNFTLEDAFLKEQQLVQKIIDRTGIKPDLSSEQQLLFPVYDKILYKASQIDKTLESSVKAELQKTQSGLYNLESKMNRAIKQKSETELNQLKTIRQKLFPGEQPQERVDNFSANYLRYGREFIGTLKQELNPLESKHILLFES